MTHVNGDIDGFPMEVTKNPKYKEEEIPEIKEEILSTENKHCIRCEKDLPYTMFNKGRARCKPCHKAWREERISKLKK